MAFDKRGFNTEDPLKEIKNHFRDLDIEYLISFISKLAQAFMYVSEVESSTDYNLVNLKRLNNLAWSLPVLIQIKFELTFRMEKLLFLSKVCILLIKEFIL